MIRIALLVGVLSSVVAGQQSEALDSSLPDRHRAEAVVRVLVWNIQRGANEFENGPEKALAVIRAVEPDVCLLQESYEIDGERPTLGRWLASELRFESWQGESPHLCILSRWPLQDSAIHAPWHGVGARITDPAGRSFHAWSIWIDYRAYGPYALRDNPGISDRDLLACETEGSSRMSQATELVDGLEQRGLLATDLPVLVGGDWNCPSHLDWTEDTARVFRFRRSLSLPVSRLMAEKGFVDAFRAVHPNPVQHPGVTWTPLDRGSPEVPMPQDRIDRLYLRQVPDSDRPRLVPVSARVLPEIFEPMTVEFRKRRFPSDHGCVVIDFEWR